MEIGLKSAQNDTDIFAGGGGEELDMGGSERGGEGGVGSAEAVVQLRRAERGPL